MVFYAEATLTMCLAIPMQLTEIDGPRGTVDTGGVSCDVRLDLVEARVGDYVLVHAGYAIGVLDEAEAAETLALLSELGALETGPKPDPKPDPETDPGSDP